MRKELWALDALLLRSAKAGRHAGKYEKRCLAGAQGVRTGVLIWVAGERRNSLLFILRMWELVRRCPRAKPIHVILDNDSIHSARQVALSLASEQGQRLRLPSLPGYCVRPTTGPTGPPKPPQDDQHNCRRIKLVDFEQARVGQRLLFLSCDGAERTLRNVTPPFKGLCRCECGCFERLPSRVSTHRCVSGLALAVPTRSKLILSRTRRNAAFLAARRLPRVAGGDA